MNTAPAEPATLSIGLISDTHGLLRPEALAALAGCDHLIHAGDIGGPDILEQLRQLAPLTVVAGNNDREAWAQGLPETQRIRLAGFSVMVVHDLHTLDMEPAAAGLDVVICGHSHRPFIQRQNGVLYVNPGSAGPRRFKLPIAVGRLELSPAGVEAQVLYLG